MLNFICITSILFIGASVFICVCWSYFVYIITKEEDERLQKAIKENKIHLTRDSDLG